jgi:hypothetical protein
VRQCGSDVRQRVRSSAAVRGSALGSWPQGTVFSKLQKAAEHCARTVVCALSYTAVIHSGRMREASCGSMMPGLLFIIYYLLIFDF